ncbi:heat shock 70 kDa protein, putative [Entamoeba invadens IP1]|uniref:Heat shock 70 kDa protein, putative n=1 Tax=Entamoeba invadens IP1 TaxID=370355 RepID=A0A0A1U4Z9_ENTIV|nr:heat shock 70 kDa protein, putative [Entamoeba invadens IP1]ELP89264.1 heat shock 70 kDa protein, putative [Entamoeba invadens IP1]|eukprot:XP_004256035.1 heat shock 70 kDa protein, putative [Entamoeba invadens IP1]
MPIAVGIDIGNRNITVAVVRKNGIDIVLNESSSRQTPTFVSFCDKERAIGEAGFGLYLRNVRNTITDVKRLLGRLYEDKDVQEELSELPYEAVKLEDGMVGLKVMLRGEEVVFRTEQIIAMLLVQVKKFTEEFTNDVFTECVISVPGYFTENQRRAMLDAAKIAGINCLRLMNEHTATALAYGIYKNDLSEKDVRNVCIIDCGHSNTTCSIIGLFKAKMKVLAVDYDWKFGGRDYDEAIGEFIRKDIQAKWKVDAKMNKRMWGRILVGAEKSIKRVISSGSPVASLSLDNLYEERDYSIKVTREDFEKMVAEMNKRVVNLIKKTIEQSMIKLEDIYAFEITGSGTRLGTLQDAISKEFNKPLSKTINCEESISRGCAIACAELQPYFRVKDYTVEDLPPYDLNMKFTTENKTVDPIPFITKSSVFPVTRVVKFNDFKKLDLVIDYASVQSLFPGTLRDGVEVKFNEFPKTKTETPQLKLRVALNTSGVLEVLDATLNEQVEEEVEEKETIEVPEEVKKEEPKKAEEPKEDKKDKKDTPVAEAEKEGENNTKEAPKKMEEEVKKETPPAEPVKPKMVKKVITKKVKKMVDKVYTCSFELKTCSLEKKMMNAFIEKEAQMQAEDNHFIETAFAKNDLEAFVYNTKQKLTDGVYVEFTTPKEAQEICEKLEKYIYWLEEDGYDETKGAYLAKKAEAEAIVKHIADKKAEKDRKIAEEKRKKEEAERKKKEEEERKKKEEEEKKKKEEEEKKKKEEAEKKAKEDAEKAKQPNQTENKENTQQAPQNK